MTGAVPPPAADDDRAVHGLLERVDALDELVALVVRHDLEVDHDALARVATSARARLRHGSSHTVIALVGSTGSGKSSLLNALTGTAVARTGVTRPTTTDTQAVVVPGRDDAGETDALLDWLEVRRRHVLRPGMTGPDIRGLVLLDLPDVDSTVRAHRDEVQRLVGLVDLMVWVTDPQKYADHAIHDGFLAPLASHAAVIDVVLNKADTLAPDDLEACLADLDRLLDADGLTMVVPRAVSATTGEGIDGLRGVLAAEVAARQAVLDRVDADLTVAADRLGTLGATAGEAGWRDRRALVDGLARAVGVDTVTDLVAAQHRRDARLRTGWPPLRWLPRFRRAPISSLPTAGASPVARAEVSQALRRAGEATAAEVEPTWRPAVRRTTAARVDPVVDALDRGTSRGVQVAAAPPRWWTPVAGLHRLLLATAAVGLVWLGALVLLDSALLLDVESFTPRWRGLPLPTLLLVGGLLAGVVVAWLCRPLAAVGARRRARAVRRRLREDVAAVADAEVLDPLGDVLADRQALVRLRRRVAGRG